MRIAIVAALLSLGATTAVAQPDLMGEIGRGAAAVSLSTSEEPALRVERRTREPSPGFLLGAAFAAWTNAAAQLAFDLANPTAAGPAHASQNGALDDFIAEDCREEGAAYRALESRSRALALDVGRVAAAAGASQVEADLWRGRRAGPAAACR